LLFLNNINIISKFLVPSTLMHLTKQKNDSPHPYNQTDNMEVHIPISMDGYIPSTLVLKPNTPFLEPFASMSVDLVGTKAEWVDAEGTHSNVCSFHVGPYAPILMVILFSNTIGICMDDIDSWWSCFPTQLGYLWWWSNRNGARGFSMEMKHPLELTWYVHCSNSQGLKSSILEPILTDKPL